MHVILLVLGLLTTVAGGAMVGFGIQYNEFGLGNTLIDAGTTAAVGGLILIGVAAIVRQVKELARALKASRPADTAALARERQQPTSRQIVRSEPMPDRPPPTRAPHPESPELASEIGELKTLAEPPPEPASPAPAAERLVPLREAPAARPERRSVEAIWRRDRSSAAAAPKVDPEQAAVRAEAPPDIPSAPDLAPPVAIRPARAPQAVTILKSGVIEGMAYTLYSDGSIEADLPQGTLRFGSIGELRDYLTKEG